MNAIRFQLLFTIVFSPAALASGVVVPVTPNQYSYGTFPVGSDGFCIEFTRTSGGTVNQYYQNSSVVPTQTSYATVTALQLNVVQHYDFEPVSSGGSYSVSFSLYSTETATGYVDIQYAFLKPCHPNSCSNHQVCTVLPACQYRCDDPPVYDCTTNNPCTSANAAAENFYFQHQNPSKYVQCSQTQQCWVKSCPLKLVWNQQNLACSWS